MKDSNKEKLAKEVKEMLNSNSGKILGMFSKTVDDLGQMVHKAEFGNSYPSMLLGLFLIYVFRNTPLEY